MNGLTLLALIAIAVGAFVAYRAGALNARRTLRAAGTGEPLRPLARPPDTTPPLALAAVPPVDATPVERASIDAERARLLLSYEAEAERMRRLAASRSAEVGQLSELARDRVRLFGELADARGEVARYRRIVVDIEDNAPPPLLDSPNAPDDLKMIVGIGPVLERMLQQLGVSTYRQIARWSERDVDEFDARLHEFPGRIRRDDWVTQARALHQSKYGDSAIARERS